MDIHDLANTVYTSPDRACLGIPTDMFFPEPGEDWRAALVVCGVCPIKVQCGQYALETGQSGLWGGTTEAERNRILSRQCQSTTPVRASHRAVQRKEYVAARMNWSAARLAAHLEISPGTVEHYKTQIRRAATTEQAAA